MTIAQRVVSKFQSQTAQSVVRRFLEAKEFPSDEALKEYLREHPQADRSNHSVSKKEEPKEGKKPSLKERLTQAIKRVPEKAKKFVEDEAYRKEAVKAAGTSVANAPKKFALNAIKHLKKDAKTYKTAGKAVSSLLKGEKLDKEQKAALKTAATTLAFEITLAALSGGTAALAHRTLSGFASTVARKIVYNAVTDDFGNFLSDFDYYKDTAAGLFDVIMKLGAERKDEDPISVLAYAIAARVAKELDKGLSAEELLSAIEAGKD